MKKYHCEICKKEISIYRGKHNKKCSLCTKKYYYCKKCNKEITKSADKGLCRSCSHKIHGKYCIDHFCLICNKKISSPLCTLCQLCYLKTIKGKNHPNFKSGKPKCQICNKELTHYDTKLCQECYTSNLIGINNPNYIDGRKSKIYYCIDCGKKLSINAYQGYKRCLKCEMIRKLKTNLIKKSCNKIEKKLSKLLLKLFKYVGNGKLWIDKFNPDFINKKRKIIIELFGDYWHKNTKQKDKLRIKTYKQHGYKTLIIWEHELKDIDKLKIKINKFVRR